MKAAVFNRYWHTGGGGEAYGAGLAHVLAQRAEVDLLGHRPVDTDWLAERLRIDLTGIGTQVVPDRPGAVTDAADDYDLFVNVSFMSGDLAPHPHSIYVVHFPNPPELGLSKRKKAVIRGLRAIGGLPAAVEYRSGFFERDSGSRGVRWTTGEGVVRVTMPARGATPVTFVFGAGRPAPTTVAVEADGEVLSELVVGGPVGRAEALWGTSATVLLDGDGPHNERTVTLRSDTFVPAEHGGQDHRALGVPLRGVRVGTGVAAHAETWLPWLGTRGAPAAWQLSYGTLVANSEFTAAWVRRWWSADSQVLHPPVTMQRRGADKAPMILNVGRFFAAEQGHSKKQLELVHAFRTLVDSGEHRWTLHLVGGCEASGRAYLDRVRKAAAGYPVVFHIDASGAELADLYASASIYWHASGMGENPERHPGRLEHFGMTTVEAMSAGAVPVVIGLAGQTETVRDGIDGYHFLRAAELVAHTCRLIADADLRARMGDSAEARAREFSLEAFGERLWAIVDGLPSRERPGRYGPAGP